MDAALFSSTDWTLLVVAVTVACFWVLTSIRYLPRGLDMAISQRVEQSIVVEHEAGAEKS